MHTVFHLFYLQDRNEEIPLEKLLPDIQTLVSTLNSTLSADSLDLLTKAQVQPDQVSTSTNKEEARISPRPRKIFSLPVQMLEFTQPSTFDVLGKCVS